MPAAAVIPAPIAYINVVAVKTLVVGCRGVPVGPADGLVGLWCALTFFPGPPVFPSLGGLAWGVLPSGARGFYLEKIRVFKAGRRLEYCSME